MSFTFDNPFAYAEIRKRILYGLESGATLFISAHPQHRLQGVVEALTEHGGWTQRHGILAISQRSLKEVKNVVKVTPLGFLTKILPEDPSLTGFSLVILDDLDLYGGEVLMALQVLRKMDIKLIVLGSSTLAEDQLYAFLPQVKSIHLDEPRSEADIFYVNSEKDPPLSLVVQVLLGLVCEERTQDMGVYLPDQLACQDLTKMIDQLREDYPQLENLILIEAPLTRSDVPSRVLDRKSVCIVGWQSHWFPSCQIWLDACLEETSLSDFPGSTNPRPIQSSKAQIHWRLAHLGQQVRRSFRILSEAQYNSLPATSLETSAWVHHRDFGVFLVLFFKVVCSLHNFQGSSWFVPPSTRILNTSSQVLHDLGILNVDNQVVSPKNASRLYEIFCVVSSPDLPYLSALLTANFLLAAEFTCLSEALSICAMLSLGLQDPFIKPKNRGHSYEVNAFRRKFGCWQGDFLSLYNLYHYYQETPSSHMLRPEVLNQAVSHRNRLKAAFKVMSSGDISQIQAAIKRGFAPNSAKKQGNSARYQTQWGQVCQGFHPSSWFHTIATLSDLPDRLLYFETWGGTLRIVHSLAA